MHFHTPLRALVLSLVLSAAASAQAPTFEHRWSGLVFNVHAPDALHAWTVEDGGRIRRTIDGGGNWTWDTTPVEAEHILRGIHVLADLTDGWAVGENSTMLHNGDVLNPSAIWSDVDLGLSIIPNDADLYDVFFADAAKGWLLAEHGLWYTEDGGGSWIPVILEDDMGNSVNLDSIELYAMDFQLGLSECIHVCDCPGGSLCTCPLTPTFGLACAEPGLIYRTLDGITWNEVFDVTDLCPPGPGFDPDEPCAETQICTNNKKYEPWDIEISDSTTSPLAIMVGGVGAACGLVFTSDDWGCSWTQEMHECAGIPDCNSPPNLTGPPQALDVFKTLFGVAIDSTDNSAIATGYNAQHLRRPPGPPGTRWNDYSLFGNVFEVPYNGAVVFPLYGAEFAPNGSVGYIVGSGGRLRTTTDGMNYTEHGSAPGDFRIMDADFVSDTKGTLTGQFFLLAATDDGGASWTPRTYIIGKPELAAVAFDSTGTFGVAVGRLDGNTPNKPEIKFTDNGGTLWQDATPPAPSQGKVLNAVAWDRGVGSKRFWAVGKGGLILETLDGGATWTTIPGPPVSGFKIFSVAFASPNGAAVVGKKGGKGIAYTWISGIWNDVSPLTTPKMKVITDVDAIGSVVYAVGTRAGGGGKKGIVLKLGTDFEQLSGAPVVQECTVGDAADDTEPLNAVTMVGTAPDDVFVAGQCGVVWEFAGGVWSRHRAETSSHVRGLSAVSNGRVYAISWRKSQIHSCITRLK